MQTTRLLIAEETLYVSSEIKDSYLPVQLKALGSKIDAHARELHHSGVTNQDPDPGRRPREDVDEETRGGEYSSACAALFSQN